MIRRKANMNIDTYLKRIACTKEQPSLSYLHNLQQTHLFTVPFENLDVIRRIPIYLCLTSIYDKVIRHNRGGYCYELNGLFHWALRQLQFDAKIVPASVMRPNGTFAKKHTHVAIIVQIDEKRYLTDVGFGHAQYAPLSLNGTVHTDVSGTYKIKQVDNDTYRLMRKKESEWRTIYEFLTTEWHLTDFHEGCVFNQVSPHSTFTQQDLVTMANPDGRITLRDHELTKTENGQTSKKTITAATKIKLLEELFRIHV